MPKEWILKRPASLPLRLTRKEKVLLEKRANATGLSMVEFARRKIFDIAVSPEDVNAGDAKERRATTKQATEATA